MKASKRPQRRNASQTGPSVSLFPFLAVLICTMGALVPLLLAMSRTARLQAEAAALAKLSEQGGELQTAREDVQWRIEQLKQSRAQTDSQVAEARLQLGHLEDHSRRLRDKLKEYERTLADFEHLENVDGQQRAQSQAELERMRAEIGMAQQQVTQARQEAAGRNRCYAVVPYEGPNQTHRRPIYLECRAEVVVLQPEGVEFTEADFEGPLGPGNPLAAALRAAREYLLSQRDFDPQAGEPYPMLLVRTEGINAYYAARAAMKSWGFDFGYELVDDAWKLAYPPPDRRLGDVVRQVVMSARAEQARLIAAAPRHYGNRPKATYRASPTRGGFVREGGGSDDEDTGYAPAGPAGPVARNAGPGGRGRGTGGSGNGSSTTGSGQGDGDAGNPYLSVVPAQNGSPVVGGGGVNGQVGGGTGTGGGGTGTGGIGTGSGNYAGTGSGSAGMGTGGTGGGNYAGVGAGDTGGDGPALTGYPTGGYSGGNGGGGGGGNGGGSGGYGSGSGGGSSGVEGGGGQGSGDAGGGPSVAGGGSGGSSVTFGSASSAGASGNGTSSCPNTATSEQGTQTGNRFATAGGEQEGNAASSGGKMERPDGYVVGEPAKEREARPKPTPERDESKESPTAGVQRGRILRPGEWEPTPEPPPKRPEEKPNDFDKKRGGKHEKSLAEKRGADWGLRDAARGSVGVTRPIRIECYADRLVIVSERNPAANRVIPLGPRTGSSIDTFISGVWEHMETWGIAGRGMFWRPVLQVHVAAGAEQRFIDLSELLDGSGLTVVRK